LQNHHLGCFSRLMPFQDPGVYYGPPMSATERHHVTVIIMIDLREARILLGHGRNKVHRRLACTVLCARTCCVPARNCPNGSPKYIAPVELRNLDKFDQLKCGEAATSRSSSVPLPTISCSRITPHDSFQKGYCKCRQIILKP